MHPWDTWPGAAPAETVQAEWQSGLGLGMKPTVHSTQVNHPASRFYLGGNRGPEKGLVSANSETCKKSTINIKPGLEGSYSDD